MIHGHVGKIKIRESCQISVCLWIASVIGIGCTTLLNWPHEYVVRADIQMDHSLSVHIL